MAEPFLGIDAFINEFGPLDDAKKLTATRLLRVVARRIRELNSDPDLDDAQQISFEVVRDAALYGDLERLSSFQNITSRRQEGGTFDEAMKVVDGYLSAKHKRMLGAFARPAYYFGD